MEYALLVLSLCVLCLRTIFTEGPAMHTRIIATNLGDNLYSLSISTCLLGAFLLWLVWNICERRFFYRPTGLEIGLVLFLIAAAVSCVFASDKRLAITHVAVFVPPVLCSILLVQILDSRAKVSFVLAVIAALGVLSAYQCFEQLVASNKEMIKQYEEDPQSMLEPLGIEPDTLQHFLFEHRLYAENVRAYFTTRNSAGSFLLLSFFAAAAICLDVFKNRRRGYDICIIPVIVIFAALILTKSKGAVIGLVFAALLIVTYILLEKTVKAHRRIIFAACVFLVLAGTFAVAWYGMKHDRLPGGNSMLVRWQYWHASAKMYADHPLTGVGPGNFACYYSRYKPAESLESVSDPHNFPLSVLSQYGPLGLVGFLAMILVPLWKIVFPKSQAQAETVREKPPAFNAKTVTFVIILWLTLLLIRLFIIPVAGLGDILVLIYVVVRFLIPAFVVFVVGLLLLKMPADKDEESERNAKTFAVAVLFCALLGSVLHNLTDFAIFEPGVYTSFWIIMACLVALSFLTQPKRRFVLAVPKLVRIVSVIAVVAVCFIYIKFALIPVASSTAKIKKANDAMSNGRYEQAHSLLEAAADADKLSPVASSLNARLYLNLYRQYPKTHRQWLIRAQECLTTAIERNSSDFKSYERLTEVYLLLSEESAGQEKTDWLDKAFSAAMDAIELYPGCGRLHFALAEIAEQAGKDDVALEQYKETIEIENMYRDQFRQMYPERQKIVSRLGEEKYRRAIEHIEKLSSRSEINNSSEQSR